MQQSKFRLYVERDGGCVHCGETEAISPNHRINRGMGGSKVLDRPANIIVLCSRLNNLIESDPKYMRLAKKYGWKLERWQRPEEWPIYDAKLGIWVLLDNDFGKITFPQQ